MSAVPNSIFRKARPISLELGGGNSRIVQARGGPDKPMFKDLVIDGTSLQTLKLEVFKLKNPNLLNQLAVSPITGILLEGPPGCGKTTVAHAVGYEAEVPFFQISAAIASNETPRDLFSKALGAAPSILFVDDLHALDLPTLTQLRTFMDQSPSALRSAHASLLVIGATNKSDAIDLPDLRNSGRLDLSITLGSLDQVARVHILSVLTRDLPVEAAVDLRSIASSTEGFLVADLAALTDLAGRLALRRIVKARKADISPKLPPDEEWWKQPWAAEDIQKQTISVADFEEAAKMVQASFGREG